MNSNTNKNSMPSGNVVYNSSIVKSIIMLAVPKVEGVKFATSSKSNNDAIVLQFSGEYNVSVDLKVAVDYGFNIPDVAYHIQQSIKHNVETMSDYKIDNVDVHVVNVNFDTTENE